MSGYRFRQMEVAEAVEISGWHYAPPYDFYDATSDPDDLEELLDAKRRKDAYLSVFDEDGPSSASSSSKGRARPWTSGSV